MRVWEGRAEVLVHVGAKKEDNKGPQPQGEGAEEVTTARYHGDPGHEQGYFGNSRTSTWGSRWQGTASSSTSW